MAGSRVVSRLSCLLGVCAVALLSIAAASAHEPLDMVEWQPSAQPPAAVYGDLLYNHQPVVEIDLDGSYLVLWVGHPESVREGAKGQRIYMSRSTDGGKTWAPRRPFLEADQFAAAPAPALHSEWQPRLRRVRMNGRPELWAAYSMSRVAADGGAWLAVRAKAGEKFQRYRIVQDKRSGQLQRVAAEGAVDPARAEPDHWSRLWTVHGRDWCPFVQSMHSLGDGRVLLTVTLVDPVAPFGAAEKRFATVIFDNGHFGPVALPEAGVVAFTDAWESSVRAIGPNDLQALVRSNDTRRARGLRVATTRSTDGGASWAPLQWASLPIHTEQPSLEDIGDGQALLSMPDNTFHRDNQSLFYFHGQGGVAALPMSQERDGVDFAHTSNVTFDEARGMALMVWSQGPVKTGPNSIWFRAQPARMQPDKLYLALRGNAAYELNNPLLRAHWIAGTRRLELPAPASAGLELPQQPGIMKLTYEIRSDVVAPQVLATLGGYLESYVWVLERRSGVATVSLLKVLRDGEQLQQQELSRQSSGVLNDRGELELTFEAGVRRGEFRWAGKTWPVPWPVLFYVGDAYQIGSGKTQGALIVNFSRSQFLHCTPVKTETLADCE